MSDLDGNSSNGSTDCSNDSLNGSWVKLDSSYRNGSEHPISIHNGEMENLLAEAVVEESRANGTCSNHDATRESLISPVYTPNEAETREMSPEITVLPPEQAPNDHSWIEDWSSRVEPHPPKKWRLTFPPRRDPTSCSRKMETEKSKTNFIQVNFYIVIPTLLITHVIAFGIGFYLGRRSSAGTTSV